MADQDPFSQSEQEEAARVNRIEKEQLAWTNILKLKLAINKASKEQATFEEQIAKLQGEEAINANKYKNQTDAILRAEKMILRAQQQGNAERERGAKAAKAMFEARQRETLQTTGGALKAQEMLFAKKKAAYAAEKKLIQDINKQGGLGFKNLGTSFLDLFKSKESRQRDIDIARIKAGGGANTGTGKGGGATGGGGAVSLAEGSKLAAGLAAAVQTAMGPVKELGSQLKNGMVASLADAASLLTGESFGMGGGKVSAGGATSILGGFSSLLKTIPLVGGALGGLADIFKQIVDAVLGVDQANFRVARSLNISAKEAETMREDFDKVALASDNIAINSTRMIQSQVELSNQLGINKRLSNDILTNDVQLRDVLGLEAESRKAIADQAMITGRNAKELTKSAIGTVGAFNKLVGTSFKWSSILSEASKLTGVIGLTFTKFPEKIYKAIAATKTLGFDLKQLDSSAGGFLDFESSISAEMEAQVITGKEMNLTLARQAALNNDYATLAKEITKNVGSAAEYLDMNRIGAEATAKAVNMTRDGLADVLKKQELYKRAGVEDEKGLVKKLNLLEQQGVQQKEISKILGEQGYETATQVSTAERLTEVMEKIKKTFVDFIRTSGLFDFLTDDAKINKFIIRITDTLSGAVSMIGKIIADILRVMSHIPGFDKTTYQGYADSVEAGSMNFASTIKSSSAALGGTPAKPIGETVGKGVAQQSTQTTTGGTTQETAAPVYTFHHVTELDGQVLTKSVTKGILTTQGQGNSLK